MTYYTPTKLYIDDEANKVGEIISSYGYKKILFIYGGGSIKKTGLYDEVVESLKNSNISYIERGGVEPNPKLSFVESLQQEKLDVDFILAVGGGSVIDTAKSYAVSHFDDINPWAYNSYQVTPTKALPIGVILTISAAGSEMSNSCVISNPKLGLKQGFNSDLVRPVFAIMNPKYTYSVSKYQTACGITDIMMHTLERYINPKTDDLADEFCIGLLRRVYLDGIKAYNNPEDYEARKNIMLASSFSHNGLTSLARGMCFRAHQFEHALSGIHDEIAHGAGLAIVWPAYSKYMYQNEVALPKFCRLAYDVLGIKPTDNKYNDAYNGIIKLEAYFKSLGMPTRLSDVGVDASEIEKLSLIVSRNKTRVLKDIFDLGYDEIKEIYELMV